MRDEWGVMGKHGERRDVGCGMWDGGCERDNMGGDVVGWRG